jgi:hypothetical protein
MLHELNSRIAHNSIGATDVQLQSVQLVESLLFGGDMGFHPLRLGFLHNTHMLVDHGLSLRYIFLSGTNPDCDHHDLVVLLVFYRFWACAISSQIPVGQAKGVMMSFLMSD